jgi:hypothetical protein
MANCLNEGCIHWLLALCARDTALPSIEGWFPSPPSLSVSATSPALEPVTLGLRIFQEPTGRVLELFVRHADTDNWISARRVCEDLTAPSPLLPLIMPFLGLTTNRNAARVAAQNTTLAAVVASKRGDRTSLGRRRQRRIVWSQ